jgi:hypothetical protein
MGAVLENHRTHTFGAKASLYKIAHHGSETAYNADIWVERLIANAYSVLTPSAVFRLSTELKEYYVTVGKPSRQHSMHIRVLKEKNAHHL